MQPASWDYTRIEYERRFLVDSAQLCVATLEPYSKLLEDHYFEFGRLRLRRQTDSDTRLVKFKLTKKFEPLSAYAGRIVSIWVSEAEYAALRTLPGTPLRKRRHYYRANGFTYCVDVFAGEMEGLVLCEFEGENEDELFSIPPPPFVTVEVTQDVFFTGGNLCRSAFAVVQAKVESLPMHCR